MTCTRNLGSFVRARIIALGAGSASYDRRRAAIAAGSSWKSSFGQEYWKIAEQAVVEVVYPETNVFDVCNVVDKKSEPDSVLEVVVGALTKQRIVRCVTSAQSGHDEVASLFGGFVGNIAERIEKYAGGLLIGLASLQQERVEVLFWSSL